ncbi:MAG: hypothetical protein DRG78_06075 [Epsilonproteobacteria bacterium]|nr:MAG: hypothetical protein DRG78_06075 [Campylobacterota bacterium]
MKKQYLLKKLFIFFCSFTILFAKQPDFLIHYHPHQNAKELVQSKEKSSLTYKQIMKEFGKAYYMVQEGIINQDKSLIRIGIEKIQNHPSSKNNPWNIVKKEDVPAFKESLLYYDEQLHKSAFEIEELLETDDWTTINNNIFKLSNHCINCHIAWKDNLKN